ncbi:MAG: HAD family phosphatase [Selenomonadaceae bacterium]|nr:HAD family phosphatase [Selenomonadaceae bacterium]
MIKLFVTDIDGTLLPAGSAIVPAKNIEAVKAMIRAGVKVVIATGRMHCAALPIAAQFGEPVPIISYNGALIKSSAGEILHAQYMDEENVLELINFFEERGWHLQSYSDDILYVPERNDCVELYEKNLRVNATVVGWNGMRERLKGVPKVLSVSLNPDEINHRLDEAKKFFGGRVEITRSAPQFAEFMSLGVSKAQAIKILAEKFSFDNSEILAIGDSDNDLAMITSVGCGVAMGNAVSAVKAAVNRITDTCENDGFAKAVYDYVL